ncbi:MAG: alanine racemase [Actinomycetota bacterium]
MTTVAYIDLSAFEHNVGKIASVVAPAQLWVAIKSNAYGHGMLELADNAIKAGASGLAVLDVPAALRLRSHGIESTLFAWLHGAETDFAAATAAGVDLGVSTLAQLEAIAATETRGRVHLKVDTGLHRNGFSIVDWAAACRRALELEASGAITVVGVWSHLADAGNDADAAAISVFDSAVTVAREIGLTPEIVHIAASSAALRNPAARHDVVRVGIAAYGISPFDDVDGVGLGLKPVLTLRTSTTDSPFGPALTSGWNDGVPQAPAGAGAWVGSGRISVDTIAPHYVLLGSPTDAMDVDVIGGDGPSAEQWARWTHTIGDEIVTSIPAHVRRVFVRP